MRELSEEELTLLREEVEKYTVEGDLRRFNSLNIRRLKEIQCYKGKRHIQVQAIWWLCHRPVEEYGWMCNIKWLCRACRFVGNGQRQIHVHGKVGLLLLI